MKIISFLILVFVLSTNSFAQITITKNDGFELSNTSPIIRLSSKSNIPYWNNCDDGTTSDIQPGNYGVSKKPTEGYNYVSLVTRKDYQPGTYETIYADLNSPFLSGVCYNISLDACLSKEFFLDDFGTYYYYFNPCYLRVYGINGMCPSSDSITSDSANISVEYKYLLWQSPLITDSNWCNYKISFSPKYKASSVALEVYFAKPYIYTNSAVLIDNLHFNSTQKIFQLVDGFLVLPNWVKNVQWYFNSQLVEGWTYSEMPNLGNGEYQVSFIDSTNCFAISEKFNFKLPPEHFQLFPNPASDYLLVNTFNYTDKNYDYAIFNTLGQLVKTDRIEVKKGSFQNKIELNSLPESAYWIVFKNNIGFVQQQCFVVVHL